MSTVVEKLLDETGRRLLLELQQNARLSYRELGKRVGLSLPAVADRIHKMEEAGIITGYHATVNLANVGLPVLAVIHLESIGGQSCTYTVSEVSKIPEVLECYRVTGNDSIIVQVAATSVDHLTRVIDQLSVYGVPATSLVRSNPFKRHAIPHESLEHTGLGQDRAP
ncbi:MAG TPA: Lrp/AsnC family transcriptional regulator [Anaerolineae bacterium]|nr:Lrp/AsnC family transcriptional regulator [Anaerolineae bacterium]